MTTAVPANPEHPWDRQDGESPRAYVWFLAYRDYPAAERSIRRMAADAGKSTSLSMFMGWSAKWGWPERAAAWDEEQRRLRDDAALENEVRMQRTLTMRHGQTGRAFLERSLRWLARMTDADLAKLTPDEVARWAKLGADMERLAYGHSTANLSVNVTEVGDGRSVDDRLAELFATRQRLAEKGVLIELPAAEEA